MCRGSMTDETRNNIFIRMSDRKDVVEFVKEIEKHQCLYDLNSTQYSNKFLKRRTWQDIAKKYKSSVSDCKEKWRKIRIAYMRSLKPSKSGHPQSRPYYLANYLQFISPNKINDDNVPTNSMASPAHSDVSLKLEIDEYNHLSDVDENMGENEQEMHDNTNERHGEIARIRSENERDNYRPRSQVNVNNVGKPAQKLKDEEKCRLPEVTREIRRSNSIACVEAQKSCLNDENNPRRMFLMSLLPDIETLNEHEMRTFRREVIALLDRITTTRESVIMTVSR